MYIVAIGWAYVVLMLAITASSLGKALVVLVFLGILPLLLFAYVAGKLVPRRRSVPVADKVRHQRDSADTEPD